MKRAAHLRTAGLAWSPEPARNVPPLRRVPRISSPQLMLTTPFLTALDERARIKGSRDPLGLQAIWARFGRHVVGNLTTVTQSLREFTVLLLGIDLAERVAEERGPGTELETFIRWEQIAAYVRIGINGEEGVRGSRRVARFLEEGRGRVVISADRQHQILGNQAIYGIWGLYTAAARASGLVEPRAIRLTPAGRGLVEGEYHPLLASKGLPLDALISLVAKPTTELAIERRQGRIPAAIAEVLGPHVREEERAVYQHHLVEGGPGDSTRGRQALLARLFEDVPDETSLSPQLFGSLARKARDAGGPELALFLDRIRTSESVIALMAQLFSLVMAMDERPIDYVAGRIHDAWGKVETIDVEAVRSLRGELAEIDPGVAERVSSVADGLVAGEHEQVVRALLAQNAWVMGTRGGAPWVVEEGGRLRVRVQDEDIALSRREELPTLWRFPYFVDSLRAVSSSLRERAP